MKKIFLFLVIFFAVPSLSSAQGSSTDLELNITQTEPVPLQAGEYADLWIRVTNTGSSDAEDAEVEIVEEFPFHLDDRKKKWKFGEIDSGERYQFRAKLRVDENAVFGENDLKFRVSSGNQNTSYTETIPLEVRTDDRSLIISELDFPERVEPGSSSEMNLTLENLANSRFRNIDVSLDVSDIPVATRETNRKRIRSLGPKSSENISYTLNIDSDAENQLHKLPVEINYQNQAGQEFTVTENTGINIGGYPSIDVDIDSSEVRTSGRGTVTFRIINRGQGQARFAEINLEETDRYDIISQDSIYLGSMIADDYQTAEFDVYINEGEGNVVFPVTVDYRSGEGDQSREFEVENELYSSSQLDRYGMSKNGSSWIIIPVVLVVLGGAVYLWRRRRKK